MPITASAPLSIISHYHTMIQYTTALVRAAGARDVSDFNRSFMTRAEWHFDTAVMPVYMRQAAIPALLRTLPH